MDVILNRTDGTVDIDGIQWMTRERLMSFYGIRKSHFYNLRNDGHILSERLFLNKNTLFYVYRIKEVGND